MKDLIKVMKNSFDEKTIIRSLMSQNDNGCELNLIGNVKDFKSQYKNDIFDGIYEDENGVVQDFRIKEYPPTIEEILGIEEYWIELQDEFEKPVQPTFFIYGKKRS